MEKVMSKAVVDVESPDQFSPYLPSPQHWADTMALEWLKQHSGKSFINKWRFFGHRATMPKSKLNWFVINTIYRPDLIGILKHCLALKGLPSGQIPTYPGVVFQAGER